MLVDEEWVMVKPFLGSESSIFINSINSVSFDWLHFELETN
jgi:hypothetical protein